MDFDGLGTPRPAPLRDEAFESEAPANGSDPTCEPEPLSAGLVRGAPLAGCFRPWPPAPESLASHLSLLPESGLWVIFEGSKPPRPARLRDEAFESDAPAYRSDPTCEPESLGARLVRDAPPHACGSFRTVWCELRSSEEELRSAMCTSSMLVVISCFGEVAAAEEGRGLGASGANVEWTSFSKSSRLFSTCGPLLFPSPT